MTTALILSVCWQVDGGEDRRTRHGEVQMDCGELPDPPLTAKEMQNIAFEAKMAFAQQMRNRKRQARVSAQEEGLT